MGKLLMLFLVALFLGGCAPRLALKGEEPRLPESVRIIELDDATREKLQLNRGDLLVSFGEDGTTKLYSSKDEKFKAGNDLPFFPSLYGIDIERKIKIKRIEINPECWYIHEGKYKPRYFPNPPCPPQ